MNIDLKSYMGFCLDTNDASVEARYLSAFCLVHDIRLVRVRAYKMLPSNYIPCGSVQWCEKFLSYKPIPNYYPDWLSPILYRDVWYGEEWIRGRKLFVKPADRYKRFTGFVTHGTWSKKKKPPYMWSEPVEFVDEWRYYISNGKVICAYWYWGPADTELYPEAPAFPVAIPSDYCGAVDLGILKDGRLALIEAQHPFACGWYGTYNDVGLYLQWLIDGWIYMNREHFRQAKAVIDTWPDWKKEASYCAQ